GRMLVVTYPLLALVVSCIGVLIAELSFGYARRERRHVARTARQTRVRISVWIAAASIALTFGAYFAHVMRPLEEKTVDTRFRIPGSYAPPKDVVLVEIRDQPFNILQEQWPFSRCEFARVIDNIAKGRPRAIAVDVQWTEPAADSDVVPGTNRSCDDPL